MSSRRPRCQQCGCVIKRGLKVPYCPTCRHMHCTGCGVLLPWAERKRLCTACQREASRRLFARSGRRCTLCRAPLEPGHPHSHCHECHREDTRFYRFCLAQRPDPRCVDCGQPVGNHNERRCAACVAQRRQARGPRLCPMCRERRRPAGQPYCHECGAIYQRWRRAYNQGDPGARALKVKKVHNWRKKEGG